jgi:hypothetical protein
LRPYLIDAIERGISKEEAKLGNEITLVEEAA